MKILAVLVLTLVTVLLFADSTCLTAKIKQTSEEKPTETSSQPNETARGNASSSKEDADTSSSRRQRAGGNLPEGNSKITNEAIPNSVPVGPPNGQKTFQNLANKTTTAQVPPPDGRIYPGGEEPYAYTPTYSPKKSKLPIVPLPDE
jgi:hypothetical protein